MTVVVAFHCSDGVVIGADSMITPSMGGLNVGHHHGKKIEILDGSQITAFAGDQGQGARFSLMAEGLYPLITQEGRTIDYPIALTASILQEFEATRASVQVNTVLAYPHNNEPKCCVFEGLLQPRLLDDNHFYVALGNGKICADPFLRFISDTFCQEGPPSVREAIFLAIWAVQYVIDTNSGGVAEPIKLSVLERNSSGELVARELSRAEIDTHTDAIKSAKSALKKWHGDLLSGEVGPNVPEPPARPTAVEQTAGDLNAPTPESGESS